MPDEDKFILKKGEFVRGLTEKELSMVRELVCPLKECRKELLELPKDAKGDRQAYCQGCSVIYTITKPDDETRNISN